MIDLHVHSIFSDGTLTPERLVALAAESGVSALALTDHDTVKGIAALQAAGRTAGILGIAGVEISAAFNPGTLHILGYFIDPGHLELTAQLAALRTGREERNRKILQKLNALGHAVTWPEVTRFAGDEVVSRLHFAHALVARGIVKSKDEAFSRLLAKGRPAYLERFHLTATDSIRLIRRAGGVPVLAHPVSLDLSREALRRFLEELRGQGLLGLEVYYSEHSPAQQAHFAQLARELDLIATGGSDFHGTDNPGLWLGRGFGQLKIPDEILPTLQAAAAGLRR